MGDVERLIKIEAIKGLSVYDICDLLDELDRVAKVHNLKMQSLESEIERLRKDNEILKNCARYYASERNWLSIQVGYGDEILIHLDDAEMIKEDDRPTRVGGKLARQTLKELGERDEY